MATAAWSQLRAPPLYSRATNTPFGLPVRDCHVPDPWLTGSAPSLGDTRATDEDLRASPQVLYSLLMGILPNTMMPSYAA
jgi:hypothetical protein